jgi:hypothetical protein
VISHRRDGEGEVALYQYGCAPPLCPRVVSPCIGAKSWGTDRVEFLYVRVGGVGQHACVWLCLESEGIVVDLDGGEGDGVGLSGRAPGGGGLYGVNRSERSLYRQGEVGRQRKKERWLQHPLKTLSA